jgi:hypothetical protein
VWKKDSLKPSCQRSIRKASLAGGLLLLLFLPACNITGLTSPLFDYLKKKVGLEIRVEEASIGLNPLHLRSNGIHLSYKKGPASWEASIKDLRLTVGWTFSWETLPWPNIHIEKLTLNHPKVMIHQPVLEKGADWTVWLRKGPAIQQLEIKDLKGQVEMGGHVFRLAPGSQILGAYDPEQGGKIEYGLKGFEGTLAAKKATFQSRSEGVFQWSWQEDRLQGKGSVKLAEAHLSWEKGRINDLSGSFSLIMAGSHLEIETSSAQFTELAWLAPDLTFQGRGMITCAGSLKMDKKELSFPEVSLKSGNVEVDFKHKERWLKGRGEGQVRITGPHLNPLITGRLVMQGTDFHLSPISAQGMEAEVHIQGRFPDLSLSRVEAKAERTDWVLAKEVLSLLRPKLRFLAQLGEKGGLLELTDLRLETENWGTLRGNLFYRPALGSVPGARIRAEGFPVSRFIGLFYPKAREPFSKDILCRGNIEWSRNSPDEPIIFKIFLAPAPFSFHWPAWEWQGEGLQAQIDLQGKWFYESNKVEWDLKQTLSGGRLLRPPWVLGFDHDSLTGRWSGTLEAGGPKGSLKGIVELAYAPLGKWRVAGEYFFKDPAEGLAGTIDIDNLLSEKAYPLLVKGPLAPAYPSLEGFHPAGDLSARLRVSQKGKDFQIRGRVMGPKMTLRIQEPSLTFPELNLNLPFSLSSSNGEPERPPFSESGWIQMTVTDSPQQISTKISLPILARTNYLEAEGNLDLPLWGGLVSLKSLKLSQPLGDIGLSADLSLKEVDLARILKLNGISGTLNGSFSPLVVSREGLRTDGTVKAAVFEGMIEGKNLAVQTPFPEKRCLQGDFFYNHLNLESITRLFAFGKITGYVQGELTDLSLCPDQPERFRLVIKTQDVPGVPKSIHLRAVENISLLGTGGDELDIEQRTFDGRSTEFAYKEIGVACSLNEDRFRINGTIIEDGQEYLVRRRITGVDIVNKNPDNEISFSDIMDRFKRMKKNPQEGIQK